MRVAVLAGGLFLFHLLEDGVVAGVARYTDVPIWSVLVTIVVATLMATWWARKVR